jgi:hypothetical protein
VAYGMGQYTCDIGQKGQTHTATAEVWTEGITSLESAGDSRYLPAASLRGGQPYALGLWDSDCAAQRVRVEAGRKEGAAASSPLILDEILIDSTFGSRSSA